MLKAKIEAILYMTDKPLRAQAIAGIVGEDLQVVRQTLLDLIHEYEERQGGLEIADEDGYTFQVRDQYANLMDQFMPIEMTAALLRTLSAIAIKQPIPQSEIIRIRGAGAYEHIKELVIKGLVMKREDEKTRSPLLSTTKAFQEYFRLTKDGKSLRTYLKKEMKKKDKEDIGPDTGIDLADEVTAGTMPEVVADRVAGMDKVAGLAPVAGLAHVAGLTEVAGLAGVAAPTTSTSASDSLSFAPETELDMSPQVAAASEQTGEFSVPDFDSETTISAEINAAPPIATMQHTISDTTTESSTVAVAPDLVDRSAADSF